MKVWIRQLALILSLAMLAGFCGVAEEIEIDGAGEGALGAAIDPEAIDLQDAELELSGDGLGDLDADLDIDLPDLEGGDPAVLEAPYDATAPNYNSTAWGELQRRFAEATYYDGMITLYKDVYAGDGDSYLVIPAGKDILLDLNGYTISRGLTEAAENGLVLAVWGKLTIKDSSNGYGWITGGFNKGNGGGVFVADGGRVTLQAGNIGGNRAAWGGGVWVSGGGLFELHGGKVCGNTATECGGGVLVTDCVASAGLTTSYGEISGNTAQYGGGVYLHNSIMEMSGAAISGNTAQYGGGVALSAGASLRMELGSIIENKAEFDGGGVCMNNEDNPPSLTMKPGSNICKNQANLGGGVCDMWGNITMNGGNISDNRATDAGGVYLKNACMDLNKGIVAQNTANNWGGGAAVDTGSTLVMQGGGISSNDAGTGGGVAVNKGGTFELKTEMLSFNTADTAGGVAVNSGGTFVMSGGSVYGNKATVGDGGGVFSWQGAVVRMSGGSISSNAAPSGKAGGGGVFPGTLYVSGTPSISGNFSGNDIDESNCALGYMEKDAHRIHVTGPLYSGARIGVDYPWPGPGVYPVTVGLGSTGYLGAFYSNKYDYPVAWDYYHNEAELRPRNTDPQPPARPETKVKLSQCKIASIKDRVYTGKVIKPALTVKYGDKALKRGTDYTVAYSGNKAVGTAKVTLTGKGHYTGSRSVSFRILPRSASISKLAAGKGSVTVSWSKRSEGGGYQLQYGLKSSFSGAKSMTLKKAGTTRATVKGLTAGRRYYFRVRAYRTVNGKTYYGAWSKAKSVVAKK